MFDWDCQHSLLAGSGMQWRAKQNHFWRLGNPDLDESFGLTQPGISIGLGDSLAQGDRNVLRRQHTRSNVVCAVGFFGFECCHRKCLRGRDRRGSWNSDNRGSGWRSFWIGCAHGERFKRRRRGRGCESDNNHDCSGQPSDSDQYRTAANGDRQL
jgi:hypothetical protein